MGLTWVVAGLIIFDAFGFGRFVIRHLTSKPLGGLAPGYAATLPGLKAYALVLMFCGLALGGLALAAEVPLAGLAAITGSLLGFVLTSIVAIVGEVKTYRVLKG
jgi:hypothetical protein